MGNLGHKKSLSDFSKRLFLWYQLYHNPIYNSLIYCLLFKCLLKGILFGITLVTYRIRNFWYLKSAWRIYNYRLKLCVKYDLSLFQRLIAGLNKLIGLRFIETRSLIQNEYIYPNNCYKSLKYLCHPSRQSFVTLIVMSFI